MASHNDLGKWGEQVARDYLTAKGFALIATNLRLGRNELDIVALRGNRIIFVEVKTRSDNFADPFDAIDSRKVRRIVRAADSFIRMHNIPHEAQFDIISVVGTPESEYKVEHIEDAFFAPLSSI